MQHCLKRAKSFKKENPINREFFGKSSSALLFSSASGTIMRGTKRSFLKCLLFPSSSRFILYSEAWIIFNKHEKTLSLMSQNRNQKDVLFESSTININTINDFHYAFYNVNHCIQCTLFDYSHSFIVLILLLIVIISLPFLCFN